MPHAHLRKKKVLEAARSHVCPVCGKAFKRNTQEKPYQCRYCFKRYGRGDVTVRHEKTNHEALYTVRLGGMEYLSKPQSTLGTRGSCVSEAGLEPHQSAQPLTEDSSRVSIEKSSRSPTSFMTRWTSYSDGRELPTVEPESEPVVHSRELTTTPARSVAFMPPIQCVTPGDPTMGIPSHATASTTVSIEDFDLDETVGLTNPEPATPGQETIKSIAPLEDSQPMPLGLMFDPLWDPSRMKRAAVFAYVLDYANEHVQNTAAVGQLLELLK
ncbi:hypothetical protein BJX68DRAFT_272893 [Aspergillus pseudodeflectus]|uniref:C2H2-type domain-containing protein n=1 Tax=Aspergillus pseudodeflectus TaxID=176178 RepID=A0ABR4JDZ4_9EURO